MSVRIREATLNDDAGIRRLLREEAMPGSIRLGYQREPNFFAGNALLGDDCRTLVAEDDARNQEIVGVACRATRQVFLNGEPTRIGYLGQLRVASTARGQWLVSRGFQALRRMHEADPVSAYLLSIVDGNREAAGVLLHRRRPGFPVLTEIAQYATLALTIHRRPRKPRPSTTCAASAAEELVTFLNTQSSRYELADRWTSERLQALATHGLCVDDVRVVRGARGEITGAAALWDQRRFKQTVVRGYAGWLGRARPAYNAVAALRGRPLLPAPGQPVRSGYLALFHVADCQADVAADLLDSIQAMACERGLAYLIAGFDTRNPLLAMAARRPHVPYTSRLYLAQWPDPAAEKGGLHEQLEQSHDRRFIHVEAAML